MAMKRTAALNDATLLLLKHLRGRLSLEQWLEVASATCQVMEQPLGKRSRAFFGSYNGYLKSEQWKSKQSEARRRAAEVCEYPQCEEPIRDVHHLAYGPEWGDEPLHFLIALCGYHHALVHDDFGEYLEKREMLRAFMQTENLHKGA